MDLQHSIKAMGKYAFTSAQHLCFTSRTRQTLIITITMQFLRTFVLSALYASAAFAATIPGGGWAGEKDIKVTIKIDHERPIVNGASIRISEQSVFSMINSPLSAHNPVILCVYVFRTLSSLIKEATHFSCWDYQCASSSDCPSWCDGCDTAAGRVSFNFRKSTGIINVLMYKNYSASVDAPCVLVYRRSVSGGSTVVYMLCSPQICKKKSH